MKKPTEKFDFNACSGCDSGVIDKIKVCSCCDDRYTIKVCTNEACGRGWGWCYNANEWVELEEDEI
jgi:hypothetical protein